MLDIFRSKYFAMISWLLTIILIGLKISGSEYPSTPIMVVACIISIERTVGYFINKYRDNLKD